MAINPSLYSSDSVEWATPQALFDLLNSEFQFTLDVCATPKNAKCEMFYTKELDGLIQSWTGRCFMNPPYGRGIIEPWMEKAVSSAKSGCTVVCLVPARTDTEWWHHNVMQHVNEIRFVRGRIRFIEAGRAEFDYGEEDQGAPFPSAVTIFRPGCRGPWTEIKVGAIR